MYNIYSYKHKTVIIFITLKLLLCICTGDDIPVKFPGVFLCDILKYIDILMLQTNIEMKSLYPNEREASR